MNCQVCGGSGNAYLGHSFGLKNCPACGGTGRQPDGATAMPIRHFEDLHMGRARARHEAGECAGIDCPYCAYNRQFAEKAEVNRWA